MKEPYFIYPDVIALQNGGLSPDREVFHRRRIAANIGNEETLRRLFGIDPDEFADFYPEENDQGMSTFNTIDNFLSNFGNPSAKATTGIISEIEEMKPIEESSRTFTIQEAYSFIREGHYQEALEIINHLNLNNPEKSIYFADQIRFLKKLIQNEALSKNSKGASKYK